MKALLSKTRGGPETLVIEEVASPRPRAGEVLIAVAACSVNYPDALIIEDNYQVKPERPFAPGSEVAGTVEVLGEGVAGFDVGQRVCAWMSFGGMAEEVAVNASSCLPIPHSMPFAEASALLVTYGTSYHALKDRARLKAGETLLVLGAAGGVGSAAVELGKAMGARVVAAASTPEKIEAAKRWGAEAGVRYPLGPFDSDGRKALAGLFKDTLGENGAHVIYDAVGGDYAEAALRAIAWGGRFLVVGFAAGIPKLPLNLTLLKGCEIAGVNFGGFAQRDPDAYVRNCAELLAYYAKGAIKPRVSEHFPFARAAEAIALVSGRRAIGKVVVTIS